MAVGIEGKIFNALADALDICAGIQNMPIAYPGIPFVPSSGQSYLRPWLLPAPSVSIGLGGADSSTSYIGIFQIDVFWPAAAGIKTPMGVASALVDFFTNQRFQPQDVVVQINEPPYLSPALEEPGWLQIPVNVRYRALERAVGVVLAAVSAQESADTAAFTGTVV